MYQITKRNYRIAEACSLFVGLLFMVSCNSKVEGCLDIAAENFDLDADKPCVNCCLYPSMTLILTQRRDSFNFQTPDTLYDIHQTPFYIHDLKYVLSSLAWEDSEGLVYTIDSSTIACGNQQIRYTHDLVQIDSRIFTYLIDSIRFFPHIQSLYFKLGWPPELQCVDETDDDVSLVFQNTNPLWDPALNQRAAIRLVVQREISIQELDTFFIHTCKQLQLPYDLDLPVGIDAKFDLSVDYAKWFKSVDVSDSSSFVTSVLENIEGSFIRTP